MTGLNDLARRIRLGEDSTLGFCQILGHGDEPGQALPLAARVMPPASPPSVTASV